MKRITIRISDEILENLQELQNKTGLDLSQLVRKILSEKKPIFICEEHRQERSAALRHIIKAGNNLNQIAKILNTLNLNGELDYKHSIYYLRVLDNIYANMKNLDEIYDDYKSVWK